MKILGIETSCDETAAAVVADGRNLLSNIVASSVDLQKRTLGVVPEVAAREQLRYIIPVINESLKKAGISPADIDALAVTVGPGLIGSLLIGVETARALAFAWQKPLIPVNHLLAHLYVNWVDDPLRTTNYGLPTFPAIALLVSGGHTELLYFESHEKIVWLGGTLDDAAGESFDKVARLLNLGYPGGPAVEQAAEKGNPYAFNFPRPMINDSNFDFSFSGLKTAVRLAVKNPSPKMLSVEDIAASFQSAVTEVLVKKTFRAVREYRVKSLLLGGGVTANKFLRRAFLDYRERNQLNLDIRVPPPSLCTDNAVGVATAAFYQEKSEPWQTVTANPNLRLCQLGNL